MNDSVFRFMFAVFGVIVVLALIIFSWFSHIVWDKYYYGPKEEKQTTVTCPGSFHIQNFVFIHDNGKVYDTFFEITGNGDIVLEGKVIGHSPKFPKFFWDRKLHRCVQEYEESGYENIKKIEYDPALVEGENPLHFMPR